MSVHGWALNTLLRGAACAADALHVCAEHDLQGVWHREHLAG